MKSAQRDRLVCLPFPVTGVTTKRHTFAPLLPQGLLAAPSASPVIATYQKLVLKTFWSATYMEIPAPLLAPDAAMAWMAAVHAAVIKPVPTVSERRCLPSF